MNQVTDTEAGVSTGRPQSKENGFSWKSLTLFFCFGLPRLASVVSRNPTIHNRGYDH